MSDASTAAMLRRLTAMNEWLAYWSGVLAQAACIEGTEDELAALFEEP